MFGSTFGRVLGMLVVGGVAFGFAGSAKAGDCPGGCGFSFGNAFVAGGLNYYAGNIVGSPSLYGYPAFRYNGFRWNNYPTFHKNRVDYHSQGQPYFGYTNYYHARSYGRCLRNHPTQPFEHPQ